MVWWSEAGVYWWRTGDGCAVEREREEGVLLLAAGWSREGWCGRVVWVVCSRGVEGQV